METNNLTKSYDLYQGKFKSNSETDLVKHCHQIIKNLIIHNFSNNIDILIDIGSGRGHDYEAWVKNKIKKVFGLEPSEKSIESAIKKYSKQSKLNKFPRINYIRSIGNELWYNGNAGLDDKSKQMLIKIFNNNIEADCIHMFWTIHYCMNTKNDFRNLFYNINHNLKVEGKLIILSMNGKLINYLMKKHNGLYQNKKDNSILFQIQAYYDYNQKKLSPYGNTIGIKLLGAYGLDNEIKENLVYSSFLIKFFIKHNYDLLIKDNFLNYGQKNNLECLQQYNLYQKRISAFYDILIFIKK